MKRILLLLIWFISVVGLNQVINLDPSSTGQLDALLTANGVRIYVSVLNTTGVETGSLVYPYNTIQEALDVSTGGELIMVYPGTYTEALTFGASNITITGLGVGNDIIVQQVTAAVVTGGAYTGNYIKDINLKVTAEIGRASCRERV